MNLVGINTRAKAMVHKWANTVATGERTEARCLPLSESEESEMLT